MMMKKFNDMLEIDILRKFNDMLEIDSQTDLGVLMGAF